MATMTKKQFRARQFGGVSPVGNLTVLPFQLVTNAAGGVTPADVETALQIGDVVDLGPLPAGMRLDDSFMRISTALTASVTGSLGFKYADGVDDAKVPQDAAYFGAGLVLNAAATLRNATSKAIVTLPKEARLILTMAGAANAKASKVDIRIIGELCGAP